MNEKVDRHKTAITRYDMSKPVSIAVQHNIIKREFSFFDYGCGKGRDVKELIENGFISSKKTLFILEGLVMYIPPESVAEIFLFITENSAKGSRVIFDYYPKSVVDGISKLEIGQNIRNHLIKIGEPLQFGIKEEEMTNFLKEFGFSSIENVTSEDYKKAYFKGKNEKRDVCELLYFAHAVV